MGSIKLYRIRAILWCVSSFGLLGPADGQVDPGEDRVGQEQAEVGGQQQGGYGGQQQGGWGGQQQGGYY